MINLSYIFIQIFTIILIAPLSYGIIIKIKALTQKRKGPPILQMYFDLYKLFKKKTVISEVSSWIFKTTPYIVFATATIGTLFVPVTTLYTQRGFSGDIIMLVYILALGRFFVAISALDTASTFGGMGSSREVMISSLMEPSLLVSVFTIGLVAKSTSIYEIMKSMKSFNFVFEQPVFIMMFISLFIIIIAETTRIPIDDPSTHLELTMVHEAMILEYSGRHLALIELGAAIKQLILITLMVNIFMPHDQFIAISGIGALGISLLIYLAKVIFMSILIALVEVNTVKLRFFSVPNLAALSFILSLLGSLQYFVFGR